MTRKLKVGYRYLHKIAGKGKSTPKITIQGDYLKHAGFNTGTDMNVSVEHNRIIIVANGQNERTVHRPD